MQKEQKKTHDNTAEGKGTKTRRLAEKISDEVTEFIEEANESAHIVEYLMRSLGSWRRRPDPARDNDERAANKGRMIIALINLLAEKAEELRDDATFSIEQLEKIVNR